MDKKAFFVTSLLNWFSENGRDFPWRKTKDPYEILIAEKMLQQTSYGHVLKIYAKFLEIYPNVGYLSYAEEKDVKNIIKPLGFHNQRAKQLVNLSKQIMENNSGQIPNNRNELLDLDGIGPYVSNAVLCFAFNQHVPIVDVNVRRIIGRFFGWDTSIDKKTELKIKALLPIRYPKEFNWGIIDFASVICRRKPKCKRCIMKKGCDYADYIIRS